MNDHRRLKLGRNRTRLTVSFVLNHNPPLYFFVHRSSLNVFHISQRTVIVVHETHDFTGVGIYPLTGFEAVPIFPYVGENGMKWSEMPQ